MGKRRTILYLTTAVLLVLVFVLFLTQREQSSIPFSVQVTAGEKTESIALWESDAGECYVFLPSYAQLEHAQIHLHTGNPVSLDGVQLKEGMSCGVFQPEIPYVLAYSAWGITKQKTVTFLQSANVAAMYIDTQSGSMEYIHEKKGNEETGALRLFTADGVVDYAGNLESINGRGNNTWDFFKKKPYSLTLSEEADLLGMGQAQKWILLANADDSSNLRNKIVYDFTDAVGLPYSPDSQWVDLYLNGEYAGLYLLCERNELHPERIDIGQTNSFVVAVEKIDRLTTQNYSHVVTDAKQALRVHYPENPANDTLVDLASVWQSVENAILAEDGIDKVSGKSWLDQVDLDSWVKKYLIEEIFANGDACFISQYFYFDGSEKDGKIHAGPVWDYDHTMGTKVAWALMAPNTLYANRLHVKDGFDSPWFYELYQKEEFYDRMIEIYSREFLPALNSLLNETVFAYAAQIDQASKMNSVRWFDDMQTVFSEAEYICGFMEKRIGFLNNVWLEDAAYHIVKADQGFGGFYAYYAVYPGECLNYLPEFEDTELQQFLGWYYTESNEPFDPEKPINEDIEIHAKWADNSAKKMGQIIKLVPLGIVAVMGLVILIVDIRRMKKSR